MNTTLQDCVISFTDLSNADFTGATLSNVLIMGVFLNNVNLTNADLEGSSLRGSIGTGIQADGANFRNVDFQGARVNFSSAHEADFSWADFTSVTSISGDLSSLGSTDYIRMPSAGTWWPSAGGDAIVGKNMDLTGVDLRNEDFTNRDLSNLRLQRCDLRGQVFRGSTMQNFLSAGSDLRGADFRDIATPYRLFFEREHQYWSHDQGLNTDARGAWLTGLALSPLCHWCGTDDVKPGTLLSGAHVSGATLFSGAGIDATDLDLGADGLAFLQPQGTAVDANGSGTIVWQGGHLTDVDLHGLDFSSIPRGFPVSDFPDTPWSHTADWLTTFFADVHWTRVNASGVTFPAGCQFTNVELTGVNFTGANLTGCDFSGATLSNVNFTGANLTGANFGGVDLASVNLTGVIGYP